ncbi:MAG TPA: hypothetical protein VJB57_12400 [Dehalococcoidia bacterium]|nr:hypothetical protein [Dehalococcoidia bacterium]
MKMAEVTIPEMVRNGTMSAEMAAVIWAAVDEQVSFLTVAIPRFAGKTTTSNAALALRAPHVPLHWVDGRPAHMEQLKQQRTGGYLAVEEFDRAPMPGYIWGEPVRRVFETVATGGYALQAVLHAHSVEQAVQLVTEGNGVNDEHASVFKLILYIERFGSDYSSFWRRLTNIYEVHKVEGGKPIGHPLFSWNRTADRFEKLMDPHQWAQDRAGLARRAELMSSLANAGRTSSEEVAAALAQFR